MAKHKKKEVLKLLEQAVEERGAGFVYPEEWKSETGGCTYRQYERDQPTDEPACIVGVVFDKLGLLDHPDLQEGTFGYLSGTILDQFSYAAQEVLATAQRMQDNGNSWGVALDYAKEVAGVA